MNEPTMQASVAAAPIRVADGRPWSEMLIALTRFAFDATILVVMTLVVAGYFGTVTWLLDMVTFFRPHVAFMALVVLLLALASGSRIRIVVGFALLIAAALPLAVPAVPMAIGASTANFRVLTTNVMGGTNTDADAYRRLVASVAPDLVVAEEVMPIWRQILGGLPGYSYTAGPEFQDGGMPLMIASRYPVKASRVRWHKHPAQDLRLGGGVPIRLEIDRPGGARPLVVYAIHPPTPRSFAAWMERNAYLDEIAQQAGNDAKTAEVIVAGDWNTPYWSPFFARMMQRAGLRASEGAWPSPTRIFREFGAPDFLGSPIDHVEVSPEIGVVSLNVGGEFGSDHLPVIADLALP